MSDLPTIRPEDVSPDSPLRLAPTSQFVVGQFGNLGFEIRSQHRSEAEAKRSAIRLRKGLRGSGTNARRVIREEPT